MKIKGQIRCPKCDKKVDDYMIEEKRMDSVLIKIMRRRVRKNEVSEPVYSVPEK